MGGCRRAPKVNIVHQMRQVQSIVSHVSVVIQMELQASNHVHHVLMVPINSYSLSFSMPSHDIDILIKQVNIPTVAKPTNARIVKLVVINQIQMQLIVSIVRLERVRQRLVKCRVFPVVMVLPLCLRFPSCITNP
jgi:ABC-type methionine transport system ATPase subunit